MKDKHESVIVTFGEDVDDALVNDPEWRQLAELSQEAARVHETDSDIEWRRLHRAEAAFGERLLGRLKAVVSTVASVARRVRAARSVRRTRKAKAATKAPADEPPPAIVEDLVYADDLEPFVRIMGRLIATSLLS
jgi:hypothetical protein